MPRLRLPPPTEKTQDRVAAEMRDPSSHDANVPSHPSSFKRAVSSRHVVRRCVGLEAAELAEVFDGVARVRRGSADAEHEQAGRPRAHGAERWCRPSISSRSMEPTRRAVSSRYVSLKGRHAPSPGLDGRGRRACGTSRTC